MIANHCDLAQRTRFAKHRICDLHSMETATRRCKAGGMEHVHVHERKESALQAVRIER